MYLSRCEGEGGSKIGVMMEHQASHVGLLGRKLQSTPAADNPRYAVGYMSDNFC